MSHPDVRASWRHALVDYWEPFRRGLSSPSMLSTVICLGLAALYLFALFGLVNEKVLIDHGDRFLTQSGTDYDLFVTREALRLARERTDGRPDVDPDRGVDNALFAAEAGSGAGVS
jgi:hypothetical protein